MWEGVHHRWTRHQLPDLGSKVAVAASVFLERPLLARRVKRSQSKDADVRRKARRELASTDGDRGGCRSCRVHWCKVNRRWSRRCNICDDHDLHRGGPECHETRRWMHRRAKVQVLKATMDRPSPNYIGAPPLDPLSSTGPDPRSHYDPKGPPLPAHRFGLPRSFDQNGEKRMRVST